MLVRPVTMKDHAALLQLAKEAGYGMTSLPQDAEVLAKKIQWSEQSFADTPPKPHEHRFLFVMEDPESGEIVGSTGVKGHIGLSSPFYSYKVSTIVQTNHEMEIYVRNRVLHMVNDYTGAAEVGSLFLRPSHRRDGLGKFLSRCRFLMIAEFPKLFGETVIAEIRGVNDANGDSPFYDNLARHFFKMPFREADYVHATKGGQFIADLMPRYPIYVEMLRPEAQAVVGQANEASVPAVEMLKREGFAYMRYIDIFDAGPTMRVGRDQITTVTHSRQVTVGDIASDVSGPRMMIGTHQLADYRMTLGEITWQSDTSIVLSKKSAELLGVKKGDTLRVAA
jgi:arginine N-succinyltransferase